MLSLGWTYLNDHLYNGLSKEHIRVIFEAVCQELKQCSCFLGNPCIELTHGLDGLNFELNAKIRQVSTDLFE